MVANNVNISIAMATFNGAKYISKQIESILSQLLPGDELVISDDGSTDDTVKIIESYMKKYNCIKFLENKKRHGVVGNFENALYNCKNDYIFLSDQDDIWKNTKRNEILNVFSLNNCVLVLHNANIYYEDSNSYDSDTMYEKLGFSKNLFSVIKKNPYIGCCMAFKKELLEKVLPIPDENKITIHDWWIAICAIRYGKVSYCNKNLIDYRIHSNNTLGFNKTTLKYKIKKRLNMVLFLLKKR